MTEPGADIQADDAPRGWWRLVSGRAHYFTGRSDFLAVCRHRMVAVAGARPDEDLQGRCEQCTAWYEEREAPAS